MSQFEISIFFIALNVQAYLIHKWACERDSAIAKRLNETDDKLNRILKRLGEE